MDIQCIALDLDRTTLDAHGKLSTGNRKALLRAMQKGVHIVIASGRSFYTLPADVLAVPGIEYAITSNGAAVYHIPTETCLHQYKMTADSVFQILSLGESYPIAFEAFIDGTAYAEASYIDDPVSFGASPQAIPYIQHTRNKVFGMKSFIKENGQKIDSLDIVVGSPRMKDEIWKHLTQISKDIYITSSVAQLIEISHKDAGKHSGLCFIKDHLNLSRQQIAAFGDGDNDVDLLQAAGIGIAMENASPKCKSAANAITKRHDEDGVAWGIKHILHIN